MVDGSPTHGLRRMAELVGLASLLMSRSRSHEIVSPDAIQRIFVPAIAAKQIKFFFNDDGQVVAYVVWALLSEAVEQRVLRTGWFDLHESECNEGNSLWLVGFLCPHGNLRYVMADLRSNLFLLMLTSAMSVERERSDSHARLSAISALASFQGAATFRHSWADPCEVSISKYCRHIREPVRLRHRRRRRVHRVGAIRVPDLPRFSREFSNEIATGRLPIAL